MVEKEDGCGGLLDMVGGVGEDVHQHERKVIRAEEKAEK